MKNRCRKLAWVMILIAGCCASSATAQLNRRFIRGGPAGAGMVNLPYMVNDNAGNMWRIYQTGWMQQQGNMPQYSQGAMISIGGAQPVQANNTARLDAKTGELVIENMQAGAFSITRRILISKDDNSVRYIDIIQNTQAQEQTAAVEFSSTLNFGVNGAQFVVDPKHKDQNIAAVIQTGSGQSVVELYSGKGAKQAPTIVWPQNNNVVQASISLAIPAGKQAALLHIHKIAATSDVGTQFCNELKESVLMKSLPLDIRRLIVNFPNPGGYIGDFELLRGDLLDIVELRGGDQFHGTLTETSLDLQASYGPVAIAADSVVGVINVGQFRPRQLIITADGQIFGGHLKKPTLSMLLTSGQTTEIPLAQVSRVGYRKRDNQGAEWTLDHPMVQLRGGERMFIKPIAGPLDVASRYGKLSLPSGAIASVSFQNEDSGVHEITLADGSKFAGLLEPQQFDLVLEAGGQSASLPASAIARLQLIGKSPEIDDSAPVIHLLNDDALVGVLTGALNLQTTFDSIAINASEIKTMARVKESAGDVQITLWDGTTLTGQLNETVLAVQLRCGVPMNLPLALLEEYSQPQPQPSASMVKKIKDLIADLNADDWKVRDRSSAALIGMGTVAAGPLKSLRANQPPEAQKAIDLILQKLDEMKKKDKPAVAAPRPVSQN